MANKNGPIGWGKPNIIAKDLDTEGAKWFKLPTPKDGTTQLSTNKGDKKEATIEGGQNEDERYNANTYTLAYSLRRNTTRKKPFPDKDGVIAHRYAVFVQPENIKVPGPFLQKTVVSIEDSFDTTDGGMLPYSHDTLVPDDDSNQVKWGTITKDLSKLQEGDTLADADFDFKDMDAEETKETTGQTT